MHLQQTRTHTHSLKHLPELGAADHYTLLRMSIGRDVSSPPSLNCCHFSQECFPLVHIMSNDAIDWQVSLMEERVRNILTTSVSGHMSSEIKTMEDNWKTAFSQSRRPKEKEKDHSRLIHPLVISKNFKIWLLKFHPAALHHVTSVSVWPFPYRPLKSDNNTSFFRFFWPVKQQFHANSRRERNKVDE